MFQYLTQPFRFIWFMFYFLGLFFKSNYKIFADILTPKLHVEPGIVKLPLDSRNDFELTMLAVLISLTPGTRVLAIKSDPPTFYVHGVFADNAEVFRNELHDLESRMIKAIRLPKNAKIGSTI